MSISSPTRASVSMAEQKREREPRHLAALIGAQSVRQLRIRQRGLH